MCKTTKDYRAPGAIARLPGERWADFNARQIAHRAENTPKPKRKPRVSRAKAAVRQRNANRVDGLDRDDIGLSADY